MDRPYPPDDVFTMNVVGGFMPSLEVVAWVREQIIADTGSLHNPDHAHLEHADIGVLWAGVRNARRGRVVLGTAEQVAFRGNAWQKARQEQQMQDWFGMVPDFVITLDAGFCSEAPDVEFAALVEHELYHCAQAINEYGVPKFSKQTGMPLFTLRAHDVEEFVGVVRRYGVGHADGAMQALVTAAQGRPEVAKVDIARACGTCSLRAAG
ncbi:putative metallopeptidase [Alloalcanivorax xenomutans]